MAKFIVMTNSLRVSRRQKDALTNYLTGRGWGVWHWFDDAWLLADVPDSESSGSIGRAIEQHVSPKPAQFLVLKADAGRNAYGLLGFESIDWLKDKWLADPEPRAADDLNNPAPHLAGEGPE